MIKRVNDISEWATEIAARLQKVRDSWSDESKETQQEYIDDEIEFCLSDVGADSGDLRDQLVKALFELEDEFRPVNPIKPTKLAAVEQKSDQDETSVDGDTNLEGFVRSWNQMSLLDQERFKQLSGLSLASDYEPIVTNYKTSEYLFHSFDVDVDKLNGDLLADVKSDLKLTASDKVSLERMIKLSLIILDHIFKLQPIMEQLWFDYVPKDVSNKVRLNFRGSIKELAANYLENGSKDSEESIYDELDMLKNLIVATVSSLSNGASEFGAEYSKLYRPDSIENEVLTSADGDRKEALKNIETLSWKKYKELAKNITPDYMEEEFQKIFGKVMAKWMKSLY